MPIGDRLTAITDTSPEIQNDPSTALALAQSSLDDKQIVQASQMYNGAAVISSQVESLNKLKKADQDRAWEGMTKGQQQTYLKFGYKPVEYEDKSILRRVTRGIGGALNVADPVDLLGKTMTGFQAASDFMTHSYRFTKETVFDDEKDSFGSAYRKWKATTNGERYYNEDDLSKLKRIVGSENMDLAISLAAGETPEEYLENQGTSSNDPEFTEKIVALYGMVVDPTITEAVEFLAQNKISPGRDWAARAGMSRNDTVPSWIPVIGGKNNFDVVSGFGDATYRVVADPTLLGGKAYKAYKLGKYAIDPGKVALEIEAYRNLVDVPIGPLETGSDVMNIPSIADFAKSATGGGIKARLGDAASVRRAADIIAKRFAETTATQSDAPLAQLIRELPGSQRLLSSLGHYHQAIPGGIKTADDVFDFYQTAAGITGMLSDNFSRYTFVKDSALVLPRASRFTPIKGAVKEGIEMVIDAGRFGESKLVKGSWNPVRLTAEGIHGMTNLIPKSGYINPYAADGVELYSQVLKYHLPKKMRDEMIGEFIAGSNNYTLKTAIYRNSVEQMARDAGMFETKSGMKLVDKVIRRTHMNFSAFGLDRKLLPGGQEVNAGIWPYQMRNAHYIPSFRSWMEAAKDAGPLSLMGERALEFTMTKVWKPSVLLRVSFIPRAFGEELIWAVANKGPSAVWKGQLMQLAGVRAGAKKGWDNAIYDPTETLAWLKPANAMANQLSRWAPKAMKQARALAQDTAARAVGTVTPGQSVESFVRKLNTEYVTGIMTEATRGAAYALLPRDMRVGIDHLMKHQEVAKTSFAETISARNSMVGDVRTVDAGLDYKLQVKNEDGSFDWIGLKLDEFGPMNVQMEGIEGRNRYAHAGEALTSDSVGRLPTDAFDRQLYPQEISESVAKAQELGFEVNNLQDLRRLIPDDMPSSWDAFLAKQGLDPETLGRYKGIAIQGGEQGAIATETIALMETTSATDVGHFVNHLMTKGYAEHEARKVIDLATKGDLPLRVRKSLFQRNGVLDRHIAAQELATNRKLIDSVDLPEHMAEDFMDAIDNAIPIDNMDEFEAQLQRFYDDGHKGIEAFVDAARHSGADEVELAKGIEKIHAKWKRQGFDGVIDSSGRSATLFTDGAKLDIGPRQAVATQERKLLDDYYDAMEKGDLAKQRIIIKQMQSSRLMRGDHEEIMQKAEQLTSNGKGVGLAQPVAKGQRRVYTVQAPSSTLSANPNLTVDPLIQAEGFIPMVSDQAIELGADGVKGHAWFTADYNQAKAMAEGARTQLGAGNATVGFLDVPDEVFNKGRAFAQTEALGGLSEMGDVRQLSSVFIPEHLRANVNPMTKDTVRYARVDGNPIKYEEVAEESSLLRSQLELHEGRTTADLKRMEGVLNEHKRYLSVLDEGGEVTHEGVALDRADVEQAIEHYSLQLSERGIAAATDLATKQARYDKLEEALRTADPSPGVDIDSIVNELVEKQFQDIENYFSNPLDPTDERDLRNIAGEFLANGKLSKESMLDIPPNWLPEEISAPRMIAPDAPDNFIKKIVQGGFNAIGRAGDAMVRNPMFIHQYAEALTTVSPIMRAMLVDKKLLSTLDDIAKKTALTHDELIRQWMTLPDEVRFAKNPIKAAQLDDVEIPEQLASLTAKQAERLNKAAEHMQYVDQHISNVTMDRATNQFIPFMDDHRLRSQFQEKHRFMFPFQFAEEQFIKRWARTLKKDPTLVWKAQLTMEGFRTSGMITQNEFGEDVYVFAGGAAVQKAVGKMVSLVTGQPALLPFASPLTGSVKYAFAGGDTLERMGLPSQGPLMGFTLSMVHRFMPEVAQNKALQQFESLAYGERGMTRTVADTIFPSSFKKLWDAMVHDPESDLKMGAFMKQAAAYMESNGLAPANDAGDEEKKIYLSRLRNAARTMGLLSATLGSVAPSALTGQVPLDLSSEYKQLISTMPIEEATDVFIAKYPDAKPWTVMESKNISGAPIQYTDETFNVLKEHKGFFDRHKDAGPWFLPQSNDDDVFIRKTYHETFANEMRHRKTFEEYQRDMWFAEAADEYFDTRDDYYQAQAEMRGNKAATAENEAMWSDWKEEYYAANPTFREDLTSGESKNRRQRILNNFDETINDPDAPATSHTGYLVELVKTFREMQDSNAGFGTKNSRMVNAAKNDNKQKFALWAVEYTKEHREAQAFFNSVIRPELGELDIEGM